MSRAALAHIAVDASSRLIRAAVFSPANIHDSTMAEALILGDEDAVCADRGDDLLSGASPVASCAGASITPA